MRTDWGWESCSPSENWIVISRDVHMQMWVQVRCRSGPYFDIDRMQLFESERCLNFFVSSEAEWKSTYRIEPFVKVLYQWSQMPYFPKKHWNYCSKINRIWNYRVNPTQASSLETDFSTFLYFKRLLCLDLNTTHFHIISQSSYADNTQICSFPVYYFFHMVFRSTP